MSDIGSNDIGTQELYDLTCRLYPDAGDAVSDPRRSPEHAEPEATPSCPDECIFSYEE